MIKFFKQLLKIESKKNMTQKKITRQGIRVIEDKLIDLMEKVAGLMAEKKAKERWKSQILEQKRLLLLEGGFEERYNTQKLSYEKEISMTNEIIRGLESLINKYGEYIHKIKNYLIQFKHLIEMERFEDIQKPDLDNKNEFFLVEAYNELIIIDTYFDQNLKCLEKRQFDTCTRRTQNSNKKSFQLKKQSQNSSVRFKSKNTNEGVHKPKENFEFQYEENLIFISYVREDLDLIRPLYDKLVEKGYNVWLDEKMLLPGQDWKSEIYKAIRKSKIFIACLSSNSLTKRGFFQKELKIGIDFYEQYPEGQIYLIPTLLEHCKVPLTFEKLNWCYLYENNGINKLIEAISKSFDE